MTTALLKLGGEILRDTRSLLGVLADVVALQTHGWRFVLCHGGGPQLTELQQRLGLPAVLIAGRRVTDREGLRVAKQVLAGELGVDFVAAGLAVGLRAVSISGVSAGFVHARRWPPQRVPGQEQPVDYGLVGEISAVDPALVECLWSGGFTPVVNPLGVGTAEGAPTPPVYNINADTVAVELAAALRVDHLFLMTAVPGVLRSLGDPGSRIPRLTASEIERSIGDGTIAGGMIPKVADVLRHLGDRIEMAHVLAAEPGALAAEAARPGSRGTVLVPDSAGPSGERFDD